MLVQQRAAQQITPSFMEDRPNQDGGHKYLFPESPRGIGTEVDDNVRPLAPLGIANL